MRYASSALSFGLAASELTTVFLFSPMKILNCLSTETLKNCQLIFFFFLFFLFNFFFVFANLNFIVLQKVATGHYTELNSLLTPDEIACAQDGIVAGIVFPGRKSVRMQVWTVWAWTHMWVFLIDSCTIITVDHYRRQPNSTDNPV